MQNIEQIAKIIENNGGRLYLVGGALRDKLMGLKEMDKDYCITGLSKQKFQSLFPNAKIQGKDFPVFILNNQEFALARKEKKLGVGHKDFEFLANETITIEEELARRDVTINSIAEDVLTKQVIDPFEGRKDIKNKILRQTTNAFKEDPLRAYRIARFAAVLGFTVEENTITSMYELKDELLALSKERVFTEFKKALVSNSPSVFFDVLRRADILGVHFLEIAQLIGKEQPLKYHPEGDSYNHTMIVVDNSTKLTNNLEIRFSCLVHDLGKGTTPNEILPHHYGHEERGIEQVTALARRIGIPKSWEKCGRTAAKWHMKAGIFNKMTAKKKVEFIENVDKTILGLEGIKIVAVCDKARGKEGLQEQLQQMDFDKLGKKCLEQINGGYITNKYPNKKGNEIAQCLHEERVKWMKLIDKN